MTPREFEREGELKPSGIGAVGLRAIVIGDAKVVLPDEDNGLAERRGRSGCSGGIERAVIAVVIGVVENVEPFGEDLRAQLLGEME